METGFNIRYFKDAERLLRFAMLLTLIIAGISKFYSHGTFHDYYLSQFTRTTLRLQLPGTIYNIYLHLIPYFEVLLALALLLSKYRRYVIIAWVLYFISLETGHYILEEFATVNGIIPYILLGAITYVLPAHSSLIRRD